MYSVCIILSASFTSAKELDTWWVASEWYAQDYMVVDLLIVLKAQHLQKVFAIFRRVYKLRID